MTEPLDDGDAPFDDARAAAPDRTRLLVCAAIVVMLAFGGRLPGLLYDAWTPRIAVMLAIGPVGLALWWHRLRGRDAPAWWAAGLIAAATVSALVAANVRFSLLGYPGVSVTALTVTLVVAMWSFGRELPVADRPSFEVVVVAMVLLQVAWAVVQVTSGVDDPLLGVVFGRPTGFLVNPVYFGAVAAGGAALAVDRAVRHPSHWWIAAIAAMSAGVVMSGSRGALGGAVVVIAVSVWRERGQRSILPLAAAVVGAVTGQLLNTVAEQVPMTERLAEGADSDGRSAVWRVGWSAFVDRPILGWGFGMFRTAIQGRLDDGFVRSVAGSGQRWDDPHNIVVNIAVSTGLVGLVVAVGFFVATVRRARGPLAHCSAAIALTWLLQPAIVLTLPLAALLLGASMIDPPERAPSRRSQALRRAVPAVLGLAAGLGLLAVDAGVQRAWEQGDAEELAGKVGPLWPDPATALEAGNRAFFAALDDPSLADRALELSARPTELQPEDPQWWVFLAYRQVVFERYDDAQASLDRAFALQPNEPNAWKVSSLLADAIGDEERADADGRRACELAPALCEDDDVEAP